MKLQKLFCLAAISAISTLTISIRLAAQDPAGPPHYRVIDLGTLGGPVSAGNAINNIGWATGFSTKADGVQLATLWANGAQIPLGTLGGPSSDVAWPVKNNFGLISGILGKRRPRSFERDVFLSGLWSGQRKLLRCFRMAARSHNAASRPWR